MSVAPWKQPVISQGSSHGVYKTVRFPFLIYILNGSFSVHLCGAPSSIPAQDVDRVHQRGEYPSTCGEVRITSEDC